MFKNIKSRFLSVVLSLVTVFSLIPATNAFATATSQPMDGLARATGTIVVHQYNSCSSSDVKGYIYANEGFSILTEQANSYYVHYSISSSPGWKDGFITKNSSFESYHEYTRGGQMTASTNVYYGPDASTYNKAGSVSIDECVSVLAQNGSWYQIEYDTPSGRKRGYVQTSTVNCFSSTNISPKCFDWDYTSSDNANLQSAHHIWAGETNQYNRITSTQLPAGTRVLIITSKYMFGKYLHYVEYSNNGKFTRGWIIDGSL